MLDPRLVQLYLGKVYIAFHMPNLSANLLYSVPVAQISKVHQATKECKQDHLDILTEEDG